jgi:hypothetical protein
MATPTTALDMPYMSEATEAELDSASYIDTIEAVITSLDQGDGAKVSHSEEGHIWTFKYGSVDVFVQLTGENEFDTLTIWSPVLMLPAKNEPKLMRHLLEMNCGDTFEASFGISGDQVLVIASRIMQDISPAEISRLMTIVASIADETDDPLQEEFGMA